MSEVSSEFAYFLLIHPTIQVSNFTTSLLTTKDLKLKFNAKLISIKM